jgi:hypothetical protein
MQMILLNAELMYLYAFLISTAKSDVFPNRNGLRARMKHVISSFLFRLVLHLFQIHF